MGNSHKLLHSILFLFLILLSTASCSTTEPPDPPVPPEPIFKLELEDVSCTEAWINLTTKDLSLPAELTLKQYNQTGDSISKVLLLNTQDTLLYIDSLLPNTSYQYQASRIQHPVSSNELSVTTMDTTSHNFTWQTWTFGEHSNSVLFDVAIVGNEIWAVGQIYMKDSLGNPDNNAYNAVHWDGAEWKLFRIMFYTFCPQGTGSGSYPARAVFAPDSENIVIASGSQVAYINNGIQISRECIPASVNKLWGSSSSDLYVVGNNGNIAHWNGSQWRKLESGTDVNLQDISGQGDEIFINGYSLDYRKSVLLKLNNNNIEVVWENNSLSGTPPYGSLVFANKVLNNNLLVASSNGVYQDKLKIKHPRKQLFFSSGATYRIAGTDVNDLFTVGDWSNVWHYNGLSSQLIHSEPNTPSRFHSAAAKDNIFTAVGMRVENVIYHKATILIGRR